MLIFIHVLFLTSDPSPQFAQLFEDVYDSKPAHLLKQEAELLEHIAKYPDHYTTAH